MARSVLLELTGQETREVMRVGVARLELAGAGERRQRRLGVAKTFLKEPQVVPGPRVVALVLHGGVEQRPRRIEALQSKERDRLVRPCDPQRRVGRRGVLEVLEGDLEFLLIHRGHAEVVRPNRAGRRRDRGRGLGTRPEPRIEKRDHGNDDEAANKRVGHFVILSTLGAAHGRMGA